ncbi:hypothetical protein EDC32_10159 [Laceyella sacchari]|nr:hypothetical protein EDC32_10159 [Laceyella sacchari]
MNNAPVGLFNATLISIPCWALILYGMNLFF